MGSFAQLWEVLRNYGGMPAFDRHFSGFEICATLVRDDGSTEFPRLRKRLRNYARTELQIRGTVGCGRVFEAHQT